MDIIVSRQKPKQTIFVQLWCIYYKRYAGPVHWLSASLHQRFSWTSVCLLRYDCQPAFYRKSDLGFACGALAAVWGRKKSILFFNSFFAISLLTDYFIRQSYFWLCPFSSQVWQEALPATSAIPPSMNWLLEKRLYSMDSMPCLL